ncbi:caspase family protein [Bradyrhizobium sp. 200]|uniref:caspase family protein n=1 Tax=Bradyrhizobium sp. 200 TaxID=2782665 RepID=UPI001FFE7B3A|nr:caspase family protein [Bradyrhizobium sp. 200]
MSGLAGHLNIAAAQQPEKRIALVVGNAAYAKSPLATAANDAGLIAQTLQAAGFDVIGARDLDGDTLRKSFRDFIQKAESSGPDTVAMVYLAGYGLQLAGDNYFVPVDSAINRDTDVPIEALRTGDYIRQLASLPLKAGIVVLDAARQQPFVSGQIASGLALVEADPHMLIAFNAAPGTVAPAEQGPYGIYAQSLAEMIRTGGLPLPEVFNRVRLRVNEASKGAQVPWDSQKVDDAAFTFFERAPDAPAAPAPDQVAAIRSKPIRDLGVQEAYAAALERDTLPAYEDFLAAYPDDPMAKRVRAIAAARREAITWRRTYRADTPNAYWSYLRRYPNGPHAGDARRRLAILTAPLEPPPTFDVIDYDVPPPPPDEMIYVDRPVLAFSDPEFDFVPPPPAPVYYLPPPPDDFVVLEPPPPPIGLFILPQPIFVPIPVYVRPPRYVAPPPNNIIFANIHNRAVINNVINRPPQPGSPAAGPGAGPGAGLRPGSPPATVAPVQGGGATPTLPPAVAQRATLIQQGKAPVPPSAAVNPAARANLPAAPAGQAGRPNATLPANAPGALPPNQPLPRTNALPVPGARGAPPAPPSAAVSPGPVNPNARLAPGAPRPGSAAPAAPSAATGSRPAIGATAPTAPAGQQPRVAAPPPSAAAPPKPSATVAPRPQLQQELRRGPPPSAVQVARPPPPPAARVAPAPPPPRMAAPPPAARMAAPPPPPARMAAPSPPPRMAAPSPPPRMAAPPAPPPRMAAPPPAARPAPAAAGRVCPPGARC